MFLDRPADRPGISPASGEGPPARRAEQDQALLTEDACRALFECSMDAVMLLAPGETVLCANALAGELFGYTPEQLRAPGRMSALFAAEDPKLAALVQECRRTGQGDGVVTAVRADRSLFTVRVSARRYATPEGELRMIVALRELGEGPALNAHCAEAHPGACMRESAREMRAANAEMKRFAHALAHDLRTPIDAITGFAKVLERELGAHPPKRAGHYLARIRAAGQQLDGHVEALLSLARLTQAPLRRMEVDLSALARTVLAELQLREPQRALASRVQDGLRVQGDPWLLKIVLDNLLGNAWKFTAHRRVCEISFAAATNDHGQTVFEVGDNGVGFDMSYAGKLFGDFQRLHSHVEFPGTGIGLANVLRIVQRHGGRVWAESAQGEGARFYFTLAGESQAADGRPWTQPAQERGGCELCVDTESVRLITLPAAECCGR